MSWRSILILSSHHTCIFQVVSFPQVSPPKPCTHISSPQYLLHALSISFFSIWSSKQYSERRTNHSHIHYVVFCTPFLPCPSYLLTPWCRVLLKKLTGLQLVKKFPAFYGTRRLITVLTSVCHLSLSWANPIQSTYPHSTSWRYHPNIIHLSTPRSPQWSLSLRFPH